MIATGRRIAKFFADAADRFLFRLVIYFLLVFPAGLGVFAVNLFLGRHDSAFAKYAVFDGFISELPVLAAICLLELYLYGSRTRNRRFAAEARNCDTRLTTIIQAIPDLVYIKDTEGRHVMVNKAVEEFAGRPATDICGKVPAELLPPGLADACMRSDREPIVTGRSCRGEERYETANGVQTFDTIKTPLRDDSGKIIGLVGVSRDITARIREEEERQALQARLLQAQKLEALGHLAGGVAHDFNNLLTVIIGYADLLHRELEEDASLSTRTEEILNASREARSLVQSLFAFSSKQQISTQRLDLNALLNSGTKKLLQLLNERIIFKVHCCDDPLFIMADQIQLERVLLNLAVNARDAMSAGGELVLSSDLFEMKEDFVYRHGYGTPGTYARLSVSDTGQGIREDKMKNIFEPFFTTKEAGKGTGLGLAIVYGIVKQHNGYINAASSPGRGTTFHVYLPLASEHQAVS